MLREGTEPVARIIFNCNETGEGRHVLQVFVAMVNGGGGRVAEASESAEAVLCVLQWFGSWVWQPPCNPHGTSRGEHS